LQFAFRCFLFLIAHFIQILSFLPCVTAELNRTTTPGSYSSAQDRPLSDAPSPIQLGATTTSNETTTTKEEAGRHPASYMEVLEMLERGETPPGIRDDINDKPPNPEQPPPPARMTPLPKPWELNLQQQEQLDGDSVATPSITRKNFIENGNNDNNNDDDENSGGVIDLSPVVPDEAFQQRPLSGASSLQSPASSSRDQQQQQQEQQQQRPRSGNNASPLTSAGSKGATSIFEAATSSQGSPGVIAGRLSPSADQQGRRGAGVVTPTSLFNDANTMAPPSGDAAQAAGAGRPPRLTTVAPPIFPDEGGLGRPTSRGWRPPPIPVPTLSPDNMTSSALGSKGAEGGASGSGSRSAASGSQNSLGADFAAA
jgi:hypothetical protein